MLPECKLTRFLKLLQDSSRERHAVGLAAVAKAALNIIADATDESLTPLDVDCLTDLVREICNEGYPGLLIYLKEDAPDCKICAALAQRLTP